MKTVNRSMLRSRKGTLLVVVLGLLVALFVIGTSFSYVTLSERRAATNYLDRQRALDLALDGVEYSIARLRAEATQQHYQRITPGTAGVGPDGEYDARMYAQRTLDSAEPAVTWPRSSSTTSNGSTSPDGNWIDFDGDGSRGANETAFGTSLIPANVAPGSKGFASRVTGFQADGININQIRNPDVAFAPNETTYGPAGTYSEMGNYFRVRAIDAASMLNINNFKGAALKSVLVVLGNAIDDWITNSNPKGEYNPFPATVAQEIVLLHENLGGGITSKDQIRPIYSTLPKGEELYNLAMMFVTVNSYNDLTYRDWCEANTKVNKNTTANPNQLPDVKIWREGFTGTATQGRDGWPDWIPDTASSFAKAPVNINTATKPVLVCLFANLRANARLLFYKKQDQITEEDKLMKDKFGATVRRQNSGTTDWGRQNNRAGGLGTANEQAWYPSGEANQAIFQMVPIGPISTKFGSGPEDTSSSGGGGSDYASALAEAVIQMRMQAPFTSWQDFDYRFCQRVLLGMPDDRSNISVPDVVGAARGSFTGTDISNVFPRDLLPDATNCKHAANPLQSGDAAMNQGAFRAWYWKSTVDMIRAALNPNNVSSRWNPDYPYFQNVDRMDLTLTSAPICFSSMGVYEVTSQGEMLAKPRGANENTTQTIDVSLLLPVARRQVRTVVQIYDIMRHSSQQDFVTPVDPTIINTQGATSSTPTSAVTLVAHTRYDTKSFPYSHDELTNGSWERTPPDWNDAEDARGISYKNGEAGEDKWKGHNKWQMTSTDFGYVSMDPKDRTPVKETRPPLNPVNFWARFNESFRGRTASSTFTMFGVNSDNLSIDNTWGHLPWERKAVFEDFISTASPRHTEAALATQTTSEFDASNDGEQATKYSQLRPDGVYLGGGSLRQRNSKTESSLAFTFDKRGSDRMARLKILRYPCGAQDQGRPFCPIRDINGANFPNGVNDSTQIGQAPTSTFGTSPQDVPSTLTRLTGQAFPFRGTDDHNREAQAHRQLRSNMPYYEGTVDFWIKWDAPPQGTDQSGVPGQTNGNQIICMGEIDPASHNYSGLFGATAYGRFRDSHLAAYNDAGSDPDSGNPADDGRNRFADFEGVQFFVYKEPGGVIRFTRLYFSEALGANVIDGATSSGTTKVAQFGVAMRRIFDQVSPFGGFTGTNDICNDLTGTPGSTPGANMGFLYSRTDAWVDLSQVTAQGEDGTRQVVLRVHDWHRFTLSYNSNSNRPYGLWIDGRVVGPVVFFDDPDGLLGFRNDGAHQGPGGSGRDAAIPATGSGNPIYEFYRSTTKLLEINPEDRLTVGCIFRRQRNNDLTDQAEYDLWFGEPDDQGDVLKPSRPVFKFDSNFVAVANATIDDFRTSRTMLVPLQPVPETELRSNSRYNNAQDAEAYYEGGFLPTRGEDGQLHALPVRLGTMSWTEIRPDWDPFEMKGLNLHTSSRLEVQWAVFDDITAMDTGGAAHNLTSQKYFGTSGDRKGKEPQADDYWAYGGMTLKGAVIPSGNQVGVLVYRVYFRVSDEIDVNNVTAILDDVSVTVLTPPRKLSFIIDY